MRLRRVRLAILSDRILGSLTVMRSTWEHEHVVRWTRLHSPPA
jgi:hypothetical protein